MSINWTIPQANLGVSADGIAGRNTWRAFFRRMSVAAGATPDQGVINSLANAAIVHFPGYGILDTPQRLAWTMAETANETGGYSRFVENLNYSAEALVRTWPSRFTPASAAQYARKPELIAAKVYGDRMGNASPEDGWNYRGRGMLQLTGRAGYEAMDKWLGIGLDHNPEVAAVPALSLMIACEYYRRNKVLEAIDAGDTAKARKITNGGAVGLDHVRKLYAVALGILT